MSERFAIPHAKNYNHSLQQYNCEILTPAQDLWTHKLSLSEFWETKVTKPTVEGYQVRHLSFCVEKQLRLPMESSRSGVAVAVKSMHTEKRPQPGCSMSGIAIAHWQEAAWD